MGPARQGFRRASSAGPSRCMNAVATITPDPKYLQMKKTHSGTFIPLCLFAKTGKVAPIVEVTHIMKRAAMRRPMLPSYSLPVSQVGGVLVPADWRARRWRESARRDMMWRFEGCFWVVTAKVRACSCFRKTAVHLMPVEEVSHDCASVGVWW